jgi:hypothetical protein
VSARRYEVSFRATLTDREVDEVADKLFELGWDDICFRPIPQLDFKAEFVARGLLDPRDSLRAADQHDIQRNLK